MSDDTPQCTPLGLGLCWVLGTQRWALTSRGSSPAQRQEHPCESSGPLWVIREGFLEEGSLSRALYTSQARNEEPGQE